MLRIITLCLVIPLLPQVPLPLPQSHPSRSEICEVKLCMTAACIGSLLAGSVLACPAAPLVPYVPSLEDWSFELLGVVLPCDRGLSIAIHGSKKNW